VPIVRSGGPGVLVKDEGACPTGSFKARGLVMAVAMARELGIKRIAMPTNGNAGAALAAYASRCGIETIIFAPEETPEVNIREIAAQGGRVYRVNGQIDECGALVGRGAAEGTWFDFSTLKEPYRIEGKKTMGLELAAQLGWAAARRDLLSDGRRDRADRDVESVRRDGGAWLDRVEASAHVRCTGIGLRADRSRLRSRRRACGAVGRCSDGRCRNPGAQGGRRLPYPARRSGLGRCGACRRDPAILAAVDACAKQDGLLLCPEGGATLAAYKQALRDGLVDEEEQVVLFIARRAQISAAGRWRGA
jgi:threonine synthase